MADTEKDDFEFEYDDGGEVAEKPEIVVEDDTPEEDRGREPLPKEIVQELEADELDDYSEKVKIRLKQMKKVWHDERREKERESREKAEALTVAQRVWEENQRLKSMLSEGEQTLFGSIKQNAEFEARDAERAYREAYEAGDTDKIIESQRRMNEATYKLQQLNGYKPTLHTEEKDVPREQAPVQAPRLDPKTVAWQERNSWWGNDPEMTASALGLHQKLVNERGSQYAGTDEYWATIDKTMRRRFPDYFGEEVASKPTSRESKPATVVAPASRSRSPKKIALSRSQVAIAQRLGLTPEQYAREVAKIGV
jgi:hypothetical protein